MNIDKLRTELSQINDVEFVGGVAPEAIASAEAELGVPFPPDYQAFLREFGSGYVSSESIVGLGGAKHLDVVWLTKELRSRSSNQFPSDFLPLRNDGFGNCDCIDLSNRSAGGECRIVEFARDGISGEYRKLADNFFDWFRDLLQIVRELESHSQDR